MNTIGMKWAAFYPIRQQNTADIEKRGFSLHRGYSPGGSKSPGRYGLLVVGEDARRWQEDFSREIDEGVSSALEN